MRRHGLVFLCTLALAAIAATAGQAKTTPQIQAERAHKRAVLAQYDRIGRNLETIVQQYDGAKFRLAQTNRSLRLNERKLRVARSNLRVAKRQLMVRLVSLYVNGRPSALDVIAGATSISQLINRIESARTLSNQDAALGRQALRFARAVERRERQLRKLKRTRAAAVARLASRKSVIQGALAQQKRLLASISTTIQRLQAQEAARQRKLQAAIEARVRATIAAQRSQSTTSTGLVSSPVPIPVGNGGAGHPEAAQIALRYLGVPYVWGGASPSGFDCSGLVMYVYAQLGISLPHYTVSQWNATEPISPSQMEPGDLVFFDGLGHVGIYLGNGEFIDAPHTGSVVRIDSLTSWGGSFVGARRVP
jgi:peptidoglycan DL-endopeptidase CwlO